MNEYYSPQNNSSVLEVGSRSALSSSPYQRPISNTTVGSSLAGFSNSQRIPSPYTYHTSRLVPINSQQEQYLGDSLNTERKIK